MVALLLGNLLVASCSPAPDNEPAASEDAAHDGSEAMVPPPRSAQAGANGDEPGEIRVSRPASAAGTGTSAGTEPISGRIAVVGNVPFANVVLRSDTGSVALTGDLEPELRRLAGAIVEVRGSRIDAMPPHSAALEVSDYEIVSIDGRRPIVGLLAEREGSIWLENGDQVRLIDPPVELRGRAGARVWVIGELRGDGWTVTSHGFIRPE